MKWSGNDVRNHTDVMISYMAICAETPQISLDASPEIAWRLSGALFLHCVSEWRKLCY